jgi:hypothetical protein
VTLASAIRQAWAACAPSAQDCRLCRHFCDDPQRLERELPGLSALSSYHAAVRAEDGLCLRHDRLVNGRSRCTAFTPSAATR